MEFINKREFAATVLDKNPMTFMVYIATLSATSMMQVHSFYKVQVIWLLANKALTKVRLKYSDYTNVFLFNNAMELPENTSINEYTIKLVEDKQPPCRLIYSLEPVKLGILKIYI